MSAPVERNHTGFVDHLVDNRYVARALQNLVPGAVTGRENPAWNAARDAALPGREVHPVVLDMPQPVVSFLLGPRHDRHSPDRKSTRLNSSHEWISYAVFCLKKKKNKNKQNTLRRRRHIKAHGYG